MYEDIFAQIRQEAEKRNLKDSTYDAYCNSVSYFLRTVDKDITTLSMFVNQKVSHALV